MAAGAPSARVKPLVLGLSDSQAQLVIGHGVAPYQNLKTLNHHGAVGPTLTRHNKLVFPSPMAWVKTVSYCLAVKLHHIALGASQPDRVAAFYRDIFALPEKQRHHYESGALRSIWLDMEGVILMVEHSRLPPTRVEAVGNGLFLLAFQIRASERADLEDKLTVLGGQIEERTSFTSYCRDPEGNRLAFSHYPELPV